MPEIAEKEQLSDAERQEKWLSKNAAFLFDLLVNEILQISLKADQLQVNYRLLDIINV